MDMVIVFATFVMDLQATFPSMFIEIERAAWILFRSSISFALCLTSFLVSDWACWNLYLCYHTLLYSHLFYIHTNNSRSSSSLSRDSSSSTNPSSPKTFNLYDISDVFDLSMCLVQQQGAYFLLFFNFPKLNQHLHSKEI
jgi:uncharacterized membrane protein